LKSSPCDLKSLARHVALRRFSPNGCSRLSITGVIIYSRRPNTWTLGIDNTSVSEGCEQAVRMIRARPTVRARDVQLTAKTSTSRASHALHSTSMVLLCGPELVDLSALSSARYGGGSGALFGAALSGRVDAIVLVPRRVLKSRRVHRGATLQDRVRTHVAGQCENSFPSPTCISIRSSFMIWTPEKCASPRKSSKAFRVDNSHS